MVFFNWEFEVDDSWACCCYPKLYWGRRASVGHIILNQGLEKCISFSYTPRLAECDKWEIWLERVIERGIAMVRSES
jgi:hypothetical protein